jgi:protein-disulfide isomerase
MRPRFGALAAWLVLVFLSGRFAHAAQSEGRSKPRPLAVVAGQPIYDDDLLPSVQAQIHPLHVQEYEIKSRALDDLINRKLLEGEGKKKGMTVDQLLAQEVNAKVAEPTDAELQALYIVQKEQLGRPFEELKPQLQQLLKQAKLQDASQNYYKNLRERAGVSVFLRKPKVEVAHDPARLRGSPNAPVIIVEFSDFQCPYCRSVQATLKGLLTKYGGRVSLAFRDFPLRDIHPQAEAAAEGSRCAGEQGKFWEYHDLLFENENKLDKEALKQHAATLKLDQEQFSSCLSSGKYKAQIEQDRQLGMRAGVTGTPGFYINGNVVGGNLPQSAFEKVIEAELAADEKNKAARP